MGVFTKSVEEDLRLYPLLEEAIQNINDELEWIENKLEGVGSSNPSTFRSGGSDYNIVENSRAELITKKEKLADILKANEKEYILIKRGFKYLTDEQLEYIKLKYFENKSLREIARLKYTNKNDVASKLNKALNKIIYTRYGKAK